MKPRPIYRWKSFWLGLFVAFFLGWAWWDSMRFHTELGMDPDGEKVAVVRQEGASYFFRGLPVAGWFWRGPKQMDARALAEYFDALERLGGGRFAVRYVKVPDAVVLGSFSVVVGRVAGVALEEGEVPSEQRNSPGLMKNETQRRGGRGGSAEKRKEHR